jgi:phosphinothricin acetyltransferase
MSFTIEPAMPADFLKVAALDRIAWPIVPDVFIPDGEHIWRVWSQYATLLVARLAEVPDDPKFAEVGDIGGALVMFPTNTGELFLHKIMVHSPLRGQGVGSKLMRAGLARADAPVLLTVDPANASAVRLYENFGFHIRERVNGYYRPHEDRYLMVWTASDGGPTR